MPPVLFMCDCTDLSVCFTKRRYIGLENDIAFPHRAKTKLVNHELVQTTAIE